MSGIYSVFRTTLKLMLGRGVSKSYSQFGEDMVVKSLLRTVKNGFYVDVGCADPVLYSVTHYFYKKGWRGINIDPNPAFAGRYRALRPRDKFVNMGVGESQKEMTYHAFNDETYNSFDASEAERYIKERKDVRLLSKTPIVVRPLADILKEHDVKHIDFLNVDAQGLDLEVLNSHDWSILPTVIAVEDESFNPDTPHESPIYQLLSAKGYILKGLCQLTLIFKKK